MTSRIKDRFGAIPIGSLVRIKEPHSNPHLRRFVIGWSIALGHSDDKNAFILHTQETSPIIKIPIGFVGLLVLDNTTYYPDSQDCWGLPGEYKVLYKDKVIWIRSDYIAETKY